MLSKTHETYRLPLKTSQTVTVAAAATQNIVFTVPDDDLYFIKEVTITPGAATTVNDVLIDGVSCGEVTTFNTQNVFGAILSAWNEITINVTNGGTAAADTTINLTGYFSVQ